MNDLELCREIGIPIIDNNRCYWLVRTKGGIYFNDFFLNDYIAIGWNEIVDMDLMQEGNREDLIEKLKKTYVKKQSEEEEEEDKEVKKTGNYGLIATQLIRFISEMKKGDIVIIPSQKSNNIAFGEIIEDEVYIENINEDELEETQCSFIKRRKIKWIKRQTKSQIDIYLYRLLNSHHTITRAQDYSDIIDRTLNSFYVKNDRAHFTLQVGSKKDIKIKQLSQLIDNNISIIDEFNKFSQTNLDADNINVKLNLHSPGPVEIQGIINEVLVIGLVTVAICGGAFKFTRKNNTKQTETGVEMNSDGLLEKIIKFMDHFHNNSLDNKKFKSDLEENKNNLKIDVPDLSESLKLNDECAAEEENNDNK